LTKDKLYYYKIANDLFFVAEKIVRPSQFDTWRLFVDSQEKWYSEFNTRFPKKHNLASGTSIAAGSLLSPLCDWQNMEAWVIYVSSKIPHKFGFMFYRAADAIKSSKENNILAHFKDNNEYENFWKDFDEKASTIEMVVGISTNKIAPFQNHQGIFRNLKYILAGNSEHPGLAIPLHGFAAKWSLQVLNNKKYALVAPMTAMAKILQSNINENAYYIGKNNKILQIHGNIILAGENKSCPVYKPSPDFSFTLFDKNGDMLISLNNNSIYPWALSKIKMASSYELFTISLEALAKKWDDYL
jgi:hypothetical protein